MPSISLMEVLDSRTLLSTVDLSSRGILRITGDNGVDDVISVGLTTDGSQVRVSIAGKDDQLFDAKDVRRVIIHGRTGNDELFVEESQANFNIRTYIDGGAGNDTLLGGEETSDIFGGPGDDKIEGRGGRNNLDGGSGSDDIRGGGDIDVLWGGPGNDNLVGFDGADWIYGGSGDDTLLGFEGRDAIAGGPGADLVAGGADSDTIAGGSGNDNLDGEGGSDLIIGVSGKDTLIGGDGTDTLWGGSKRDRDVFEDDDTDSIVKFKDFSTRNGRLMKIVRKLL